MERKQIEDRINENDTAFFEQIYYGDCEDIPRGDYKIVYDQNWGDGNDYFVAIQFTKFDGMYVLLDGTYSSWDSPHWDSVKLAQPYEHKETRFKPVTKEYMRDLTLNKVLDEDKK